MERLAWGVECGDAAHWDQNDDRTCGPTEDLGDTGSQLGVLLGRGTHQGDARVMDVELAPCESVGNGGSGTEVHHVESAQAHDLGYTAFACRLEPLGAGR